MSLSETMKEHMNAVRNVTGANELLSMEMATGALNTAKGGLLPVHNVLFDDHDDINNYTEQGQYLIRNIGSDIAKRHDPCISNGWGSLFVFKNDYYVNQVMIDNNLDPAVIYHRSKNIVDNRPWTSWTKLGGVIRNLLTTIAPRTEVVAC